MFVDIYSIDRSKEQGEKKGTRAQVTRHKKVSGQKKKDNRSKEARESRE